MHISAAVLNSKITIEFFSQENIVVLSMQFQQLVNSNCSSLNCYTKSPNDEFLSTGNVVVSSVQFQLTSELNATTPTFTLNCTSTGGPATTVSWRRDGTMISDNSTYKITSQVLTDAETATYNHTLTVIGRLVGEYECNVSNNKPSSASGMQAVVGKNYYYTVSNAR